MIRVYLHCLWMLFSLDFNQRHRPTHIIEWKDNYHEDGWIKFKTEIDLWECSCGYNKK